MAASFSLWAATTTRPQYFISGRIGGDDGHRKEKKKKRRWKRMRKMEGK
jgi:hypothetical protein